MPAPAPAEPPKRVKFVAADPSRGGLPVKRKQVQQACVSCRRKKRRCVHAELSAADDTASGPESPHSQPSCASLRSGSALAPSRADGARPMSVQRRSASLRARPPRHSGDNGVQESPYKAGLGNAKPQSSRFVGDLNPEGMFLEATSSTSTRQHSQRGDVGIWLSYNGQQSHFVTPRPAPIMDRFLLPYARESCLSCIPPDDDFIKIKAIYLDRIYPIFPVISVAALDASHQSPCGVVLRQLVCLAASADAEAAPYLRLPGRGPDPLEPQDFSQSLSSALRTVLETSLVPDRVMHIQAFVVLSLYAQPTCAEEADLPAELGGRAIHQVQTLGLHLLRYDAPSCDDDLNNLFCVVWAMDRINAAFYGRPCLMHERDIGADLEACIRKQPPCFRLFLSVVYWLDQVIELYRPGPSAEATGLDKVAYIDLPVLEAMIVDVDALKVPSPLIATIETFYHAVIILSCRLPRPGTVPAATTLPPPSANARRSLAAERIACAVSKDQLSALPFVPYAVSLALSVEYRKMRHSRLPMFRARSMSAFTRNCELLRKFDSYFWNAKVVAGLGDRVLKEMERAATSLTKDAGPVSSDAESRPAPAGVGGVATASQADVPVSNATTGSADADLSFFDKRLRGGHL